MPVNRIDFTKDARPASALRFAIIDTSWNEFIVRSLTEGALATLRRHGVTDENISHVTVPGAFEIPTMAAALARKGQIDGIIALGCVIRGATPHFDYVAGEAARGIGKVAAETLIPVSFGILTTDTIEQAIERAGTKAGNKGAEAAAVAIEMARLLHAVKVAE